MAGVMDELISGVIKSAMGEILKKGLRKSTATKRTKRKVRKAATSTSATAKRATRRRTKSTIVPSGGSVGSGGAGAAHRAPAKKQVSRRRTSAARAKARRR